MKKIISFSYKALWLCCFKVRNLSCSFAFRILLWLNNVKCIGDVKCFGGAVPMLRVSPRAKKILLGKNVIFNNLNDVAWFSKCAIWVKENAVLEIGDNSGFNGALVYASNSIFIGKNVKIGGGAKIFDTDFHPLNFEVRRTSNNGTKSAPIVIEDDVFIGTSCLILKGVHIGARSTVAAGSVVTKSIPADQIWGGNPAKFIRNNGRF